MGLKRIARRSAATTAGHAAVLVLRVLTRLPWTLIRALGEAALPVYAILRARPRPNLACLRPPLPPLAYYRARLRLAWLSLRHASGLADGCEHRVEGAAEFDAALASQRHVVLLGWHQGPVELLHAIPARHLRARGNGVPCYVLTASAFAPALSDWMAARRAQEGVTVLRPEDRAGLRAFAREGGVLAVMADQVPGTPEDRIPLRDGLTAPYPVRLLEWLAPLHPAFLSVAVRVDGNVIRFRYDTLDADHLKASLSARITESLRFAPEQYNWSYGKIKREADRQEA